MARDQVNLTALARIGFSELGAARARLAEAEALGAPESALLLPLLVKAASPDAALGSVVELLRHAPEQVQRLLAEPGSAQRLLVVLGASSGVAEFFLRHPSELAVLTTPRAGVPDAAELLADLLDSVGADDGPAHAEPEVLQ